MVAFFFALIPGFGPRGTALARILASVMQVALVAIFLGAAFRTEPQGGRAADPQE